jgi:isocitrate lyase
MLTQMAKYLDTVYVSGWQSSSTASASDEPGPDLADYPYVSSHQHSHVKEVAGPNYIPRLLSPTRSVISSWPSSSTIANSARSA